MVDGETYEDVKEQLTKARDDMVRIMSQPRHGHRAGGDHVDMVSFSNDLVSDVKLSPGDVRFGGFAIVINGHSLVSVFVGY